jgi:MFS family permease
MTRAGRGEWLGLGVLALPCLLYSMDLTVLYMAVPKLAADLHPSSVQLLWVTDIYGFMLAGLLLTMGNLGDRIGRRRLLLIGAAAFGATSMLAAFATSAPTLIAARALLGVAGATLAPSTLSLLRTMFALDRSVLSVVVHSGCRVFGRRRARSRDESSSTMMRPRRGDGIVGSRSYVKSCECGCLDRVGRRIRR